MVVLLTNAVKRAPCIFRGRLMTKRRLGKLRPETLDNFRNVLRDSEERTRNREALHGSDLFPERYKRGDARLHMHARGSLAESCAIFQYAPVEAPFIGPKTGREIITPAALNRPGPPQGRNGRDKPMLVRIIDLFQPVERFFAPTTPAFVWLQPLDECLMFRSEKFDSLTSHRFEMLASEQYGKCGSPCWCFGIEERQLVDQSIKSRAEVVGDFTDGDSPIKEEWRLARAHAIDVIASLRIGGYVNRCVNDIRRRPSQPLSQRRSHPRIERRDRRLRSTQGPSDA